MYSRKAIFILPSKRRFLLTSCILATLAYYNAATLIRILGRSQVFDALWSSSSESKPISVFVNDLTSHTNVLHQPYNLLHLTRSCAVPCVFTSYDNKTGRYFTQAGKEHVWLTKRQAAVARKRADVILYRDVLPDKDERVTYAAGQKAAVIAAKPHADVYDPTNNTLLESWYNPVELVQGADINIHYNPAATIPFNFITSVYRDPEDFAARIAESVALAKPFERRSLAVMFLNDCAKLKPDERRYISRLMKYIPIHSFGDCLRNKELPSRVPGASIADLYEAKKRRIMSHYKFALVWESVSEIPGFVSEAFFHALAYPAVPVYMGARLAENMLPAENAMVLARDFADNPEALADHLAAIAKSESVHATFSEWREQPIAERFKALWKSALDAVPCALCRHVAGRAGESREVELPAEWFMKQELTFDELE